MSDEDRSSATAIASVLWTRRHPDESLDVTHSCWTGRWLGDRAITRDGDRRSVLWIFTKKKAANGHISSMHTMVTHGSRGTDRQKKKKG